MSTSTSTSASTDVAKATPRTLRWRVVDIVVASVLGVAAGLIFLAWNTLYQGPKLLLEPLLPGLQGLLDGPWLFAGVLGALIIRKPGAAIYTELLAAVVSALVGNQWGGFLTLEAGLVQGLGAELVFLLFFYRRWSLPVAILAGMGAALAGGINNLGTTIGPLLVSIAIFGSVATGNTEASIESVKTPYLVLGAAFVLVALFLKFSSVPNHIDLEQLSASEAQDGSKLIHMKSALAYPQLVLGMIGIFLYVGVEVSTIDNLPAYLELPVEKGGLGIDTALIAPFVSLYWASMMIGRWGGAAGAFDVGSTAKKVLMLVLPFVAFGVYLAVNAISGHDASQFYHYAPIIAVMIAATLASRGNPARMLLYFAVCGIAAQLIGMFTTGMTSVIAFISVGLFCSTMWPCIFTLAITGLGNNTNQGSSLLIMMIMGGGLVSWAQGALADKVGIHYSFIVGVLCFAYLGFYALYASRSLKKQGIDLDKLTAEGGH